MITHEVPLLCHTGNKLGILINNIRKDEKRADYALFLHHVKYFRYITVLISRIKGEV